MANTNDMQALALAIQQIGVNVMAIQKKLDTTSRAVDELRAAFLEAGKTGSFKPNSYGRHVFEQLIRIEADLSAARAQLTLAERAPKLPHR
jgi:hypothetical protein